MEFQVISLYIAFCGYLIGNPVLETTQGGRSTICLKGAHGVALARSPTCLVEVLAWGSTMETQWFMGILEDYKSTEPIEEFLDVEPHFTRPKTMNGPCLLVAT